MLDSGEEKVGGGVSLSSCDIFVSFSVIFL